MLVARHDDDDDLSFTEWLFRIPHVLSTLLRFNLGNHVSIFSFDLTCVLFDYFQLSIFTDPSARAGYDTRSIF